MLSCWRYRLAAIVGASAAGVYTIDATNEKRFRNQKNNYFKQSKRKSKLTELNRKPRKRLPTREKMVNTLKEKDFDVLIIGGGATGAGVALDAQTRGLRTALIEYDDFSSGTSSKSTKLLHGGVRYLQAAIQKLDYEQYKMVKEALFERSNVMEVAPHLTCAVPIILPAYKWFDLPYYWVGIKAYDFVAGSRILKSSKFVSRRETIELLPVIKDDGLKGGIVYYDGQSNDTRVNLSVIISAIRNGAQCVNHTEVIELIKSPEGKIIGAVAKDKITGETYKIRAKCVVNATGPFTDTIRRMADENVKPICMQSSGVHVTLPKYYCPGKTGLLNPNTSDGRIIFVLPWQGMAIAGTTDVAAKLTYSPTPTEDDIQFIMNELKNTLGRDLTIRREDVSSAWCGLRPLVYDPKKGDTKSLVRNHIVEVSDSGLVTIAGGKWTTFRSMAQDTVDECIKHHNLEASNICVTPGLLIEGAHLWSPMLYSRIAQEYGIEENVAKHLCSTYGDRAHDVAKLCTSTGKKYPALGVRLHPDFPYLEAEVRYAVREYAQTAIDFLARRTRIAFLNSYAANQILPRVIQIMAEELKWSAREQQRQYDMAKEFLKTEMNEIPGYNPKIDGLREELTEIEKQVTGSVFKLLDSDSKGFFTASDLRNYLKDNGHELPNDLVDDMFAEADLYGERQISLMDLTNIIAGLKAGKRKGRRMFDFLSESECVKKNCYVEFDDEKPSQKKRAENASVVMPKLDDSSSLL
ncbi:unnamed protein product [Caenorhabditis bovis]|uniref:Glycerol-3-phosphate dehydrogenase n=1 Tax=Caenorhabditis bovis TaxID=2654633 RepID=A0A8S1E6Z2_9PELO|nr:unnamed protein product [Caenorhabditis bovis]